MKAHEKRRIRDELTRKKGRIALPLPGGRHTDRRKEASRTAARGWSKRRFTDE